MIPTDTYIIDIIDDPYDPPSWMPMYISIMLVFLTIFIFLTTFIETDNAKIKTFKSQYQRVMASNATHPTGAGTGSTANHTNRADRLNTLIAQIKSNGINKKRMDDFLTLNGINGLAIRDAQQGIAVTLPEVTLFEPGQNRLTPNAVHSLYNLSYLVSELPYGVEIKGYTSGKLAPGSADALEFSAKRAYEIYRFFIDKGISPLKLRFAGCGDAFQGSSAPQDKVEIIFKSPEL
ncbi:MAG: OmpA family protein [Candidatus Omnitrophota bacterium]